MAKGDTALYMSQCVHELTAANTSVTGKKAIKDHKQINFDKIISFTRWNKGFQFTKGNCAIQCLQTCIYWPSDIRDIDKIYVLVDIQIMIIASRDL